MQINTLARAIGVTEHKPFLFDKSYAQSTRNRSAILANSYQMNNITICKKPIAKKEVALLLTFSLRLLDRLKHKALRVKDLELWFTTLQHTFYLEQIMPEMNFANIKKIIMDITEQQFIPHLSINTAGNFEPNPENAEVLIKLHHTHTKLIVMFQETFITELSEELLVRHINDGRERYAHILHEGMQNYRLFMTLQPEQWGKLVDLQDFKVVNGVFKAHADLQSELRKY